MRNVGLLTSALVLTVALTSCSLTLPVAATGNAVGSKVGTATATGYLSLLYFDGDASIRTAAKNGGISKISTVDLRRTSLLGIIDTYECIVTGE
jgi:TRL-like protein family